MTDGERPTIFGDGEQTRDFVHVDDVVEANIRACTSDESGEVLDVAGGDRSSIDQLVEELNHVLDTELQPIDDDPRPGDGRHAVASIERARALLGVEPEVDLRVELQRTIDDYG
jgi:nucleoside-diphosphate-sugar epimerase